MDCSEYVYYMYNDYHDLHKYILYIHLQISANIVNSTSNILHFIIIQCEGLTLLVYVPIIIDVCTWKSDINENYNGNDLATSM